MHETENSLACFNHSLYTILHCQHDSTRKSTRVMRPIVGASVSELNALKQTATKKPTGAQGSAIKDIKDRYVSMDHRLLLLHE